MENNRLPDTPWHVGYAKKEESDPRRHKSRCVYLKDGICKCGYDGCYTRKCGGSSHCLHYSESLEEMEKRKKEVRLEMSVRDNFAKPKGQTRVEKIMYKRKYYYKIYLSEEEAIMVPYKPQITKQEIISYIREYKNLKNIGRW